MIIENEKAVSLAKELGKALQAGEIYKEYEAARKANDEDSELQNLIAKFNMTQMNLDNETSKAERDADAIKMYSDMMSDQYRQIMESPNMARFQHAVEHLERLMSYVNAIISASVNGEDPDSVTEEECTHDCSTCGGHCH